MADETVLRRARADIDLIDDQLLTLLSQRAELAHRVALGKKNPAGGEVFYYRPEREAEVLRRLCESNPGPFADEVITAVFREVISATLALEQPLVIGMSATPGCANVLAASAHFGRLVRTRTFSSTAAALSAVGESCDLALIAIDDSHGSLFPEQLEVVLESGLLPMAEIVVTGRYGVLVSGAPAAEQAVEVFAGIDLAEHTGLPIKQISSERYSQLLNDADGAHRLLVNLDRNIAGWRLDADYLPISLPAATRFLVMGRHNCQPTGNDRTLVSAGHSEALMALAQPQLDRSALLATSGARSGRWAFILDGHCDDESVRTLVDEALTRDASVTVIGSWPVVNRQIFGD